MQDAVLIESTPKLSQGARLVDTFVAPSKTFTDVLRSANCWLPIALMVVLTIVFAFSIGKSVGYTAVTEQQIAKNEKQAAAMQQLPRSSAPHASRPLRSSHRFPRTLQASLSSSSA
jgi:hypothetical protein